MNTNTNNFSSKTSRRKILNYGKFALATGATTLAVSCQKESDKQPEGTLTTSTPIEVSREMSPDEILEILMAGNKRFVENKRTNPNISFARLTEVASG